MRILVFGAGVLGSYLGHVLHRGGNDVTLLARGEWKETIDQRGLIIRHYAQLKTTTDHIRTIGALAPSDVYDIIFVVMQYTQIAAVLSVLAQNRSKLIVFVGNNPDAMQTLRAVSADGNKSVLFGFQTSGGRRQDERLICIRLAGNMSIGAVRKEDEAAFPFIRQAFAKCRYRLNFYSDMDAWFKSHLATILPIAYAVYALGGDLTKVSNAMLHQMIGAVNEGYAVLEALGICVLPKGAADYVRQKRFVCFLALWIVCKTPIGRLAASDHAMAAIPEMRTLHEAFGKLKVQAGRTTPCWDALEKYMP